jgi:hypothetical protein
MESGRNGSCSAAAVRLSYYGTGIFSNRASSMLLSGSIPDHTNYNAED